METQDHRKPNQSGHEGHGGAHLCHKCGWPFPNPHPSSRHRRAHKRVCGTIEGYKLDNTQEKTHLDASGSGGDQRVSDDEQRIPCGKVVETTISRKNISGVGTRSSRSTRSEDDVFADAVTDFVDNPGLGGASDGIMHRENSLQKITENDPDDTKLTGGNTISDSSSVSNSHVENNQLQTVQKLEGENENVEGGMPSQDCDSTSTNNSTLVSASFTVENEKAVEQQVIQSSTASSELNLGVEEGNETSKRDLSELIGPDAPANMSEDVSALRDVSEERLDSVCADGVMKPTGMQSFEGKVECSHEVDSPVVIHALSDTAEIVDKINGNIGKSTNLIKEPDSVTDSIGNMHVIAVLDALPLQEHPDIALENLDHKRGKFNVSMSLDATLAFESIACSKDPANEESYNGSDFTKPGESSDACSRGIACSKDPANEESYNGSDFTKPGESSDACSRGDVFESIHSTEGMLNLDVRQNTSIVLQNIVEEVNQMSDAKACITDTGAFKGKEVFEGIRSETFEKVIRSSEEQKDNFPSDNISLEGPVVDGSDNQETKSEVFNDGEHVVIHENDGNQVQAEELAATSSIVAGSAPVKRVINASDGNDKDDDRKARVEDTAFNVNERIGGEDEIKATSAETESDYRLTLPGSHDGNIEAFEREENYNNGVSYQILNSSNVMVGQSQPGSLPGSEVEEMQRNDDCLGGEESINKDGTSAVVKTNDLDSPSKTTQSGVMEMLEDDSNRSSMTVGENYTEEVAQNASGAVEVDGTTKGHVVDTLVDSSSQTESLEGNWGSVSALSPMSDAPPAADRSQVSVEARTAIVEPKALDKGQHSESKTSVEPQASQLEQKAGASEIQTSQIKQQQNSALQTGWSPSVAHIADNQHPGKTNEEIIAKVTNWNIEKQHTPLKTLLGEATTRSRAESPNNDDSPITDCHKEEIPSSKNGFSANTEHVILGTKQAAKEDLGKEWNSPARYPVNIKTEKKRAKNRPYWVPFLCCSSVNAAR